MVRVRRERFVIPAGESPAPVKVVPAGYERRNGYAWLGYWPQALLEKECPVWKQKMARTKVR